MTLTTRQLRAAFELAAASVNNKTAALSQLTFFDQYPQIPEWAVGPFVPAQRLTFELDGQWPDPDDIGWRSTSIFNPTLITRGEELHLFYRASPYKESLASRIGHAVYTDLHGWRDLGEPALRSTLDNEVLGVEDPKVYRSDDGYVLFYNAIFPLEDPSVGLPADTQNPGPAVGCDINVATSSDLRTWKKQGAITDRTVSRQWAKGAVIPRSPNGTAIRIDGNYLMYASEGFGGQLHVGASTDLLTWQFQPCDYLDLSGLGGGQLHEVATAVVNGSDLVLDFFYSNTAGVMAAAQALYDLRKPFRQLGISPGGTLAWGGLIDWQDTWLFAQGWDAPDGHRQLHFYRAPIRRHSADATLSSG